jgi:hypothetical protein
MLLVINHERHYRLYVLKDHERNRREYQKAAFATLNVIRIRVITKVMVEYLKVCYSSMSSRLEFTTLIMERYSLSHSVL